jgi:hypothetical protein
VSFKRGRQQCTLHRLNYRKLSRLRNIKDSDSLNIPDDLLIQDLADPLLSLIDFVYSSFLENMKKPFFFKSVVYFLQLLKQSSMLMIIFYRWSPEVRKNILALIWFVNQMQIVRYTVKWMVHNRNFKWY